jgi:hypothetical protein
MSGVEDTQSFTPYTISWDKFESNFVKIEKMDLYRCNILVTFQTDDKFENILSCVKPQELTIRVCDKEGQGQRNIKLSSNMNYMKIIGDEPISITFEKMEITEIKK